MARDPFTPNLFTTAAKGGKHEMEESTLRGKFISKNGNETYYYLGPVTLRMSTSLSEVFTPDDFNKVFEKAFPMYKNTGRKASDMYLAYLQSWGFIELNSKKEGDKDRTYRLVRGNDLSRFRREPEQKLNDTSKQIILSIHGARDAKELKQILGKRKEAIKNELQQIDSTLALFAHS